MLETYSGYYSEVSDNCDSFLSTFEGIQFDVDENPAELFLITSMHIIASNTKTISWLLSNNQFGPIMVISRVLMELFFNIHWIFEPIERDAVHERIFQLEGDYLYHIEKEISLMERDQFSENPSWSEQQILDFKNFIKFEGKYSPNLLTSKDGKPVFKRPPPIANRMAGDRIKYYQLYIFTTLFAHPSPKLREFYLQNEKVNLKSRELTLLEIVARCLDLIEWTVGYAETNFRDTLKVGKDLRLKSYMRIKEIAKIVTSEVFDGG